MATAPLRPFVDLSADRGHLHAVHLADGERHRPHRSVHLRLADRGRRHCAQALLAGAVRPPLDRILSAARLERHTGLRAGGRGGPPDDPVADRHRRHPLFHRRRVSRLAAPALSYRDLARLRRDRRAVPLRRRSDQRDRGNLKRAVGLPDQTRLAVSAYSISAAAVFLEITTNTALSNGCASAAKPASGELPIHSTPVPNNVRYASDSDHSRHESELTLSAISKHLRNELREIERPPRGGLSH